MIVHWSAGNQPSDQRCDHRDQELAAGEVKRVVEEARNMAARAREVGTQLADLGLQIACVGLEPVHGLLSYLER